VRGGQNPVQDTIGYGLTSEFGTHVPTAVDDAVQILEHRQRHLAVVDASCIRRQL
jgi:hypothetical protein